MSDAGHRGKDKGHYEVKEELCATNYVWVEGEEVVGGRLVEQILHPWHAPYAEWVKATRAHPELQEQMEMEALQ